MRGILYRAARSFFLLASFFAVFPFASNAQVTCINEIYNSSGQDEWIELLTTAEGVDLRGFQIRDFTSNGAAQPPILFTENALWSNLPRGTIIVVARAETVSPEDTDPSDYRLVIKVNNALFFSSSGTSFFLFAGGSDAIQLLDRVGTHIFGLSWGAANATSVPQPKVHFDLALSSGTSIAFQGGSLSNLSNSGSWAFATPPTNGAGNSTANVAWISTLRATVDGSGSARVLPDTLTHGQSVTMNITFRKDSSNPAVGIRVILPPGFSWSRSASDISLLSISATVAVSGDTVTVAPITSLGDSGSVRIAGVVAPDSTAFYSLRVESRVLSSFRPVSPQPRVTVFGLPVPVVQAKGNDANGIPLRAGQLVTVRGIVTVANQFGGPSYIQDYTAGLAIFGSRFSSAVAIGDEVVVSGVVDPFNGLTEITSPVLHGIVSSGNRIDPVAYTCAQISNDGAGGVEAYEGMLVRINNVILRDQNFGVPGTWAVSGSGTNYRLLDATDTVDVRIDDLVDLANTPAPQGSFDIVGVVSQFKSAAPFIGGYQLMPRAQTDVTASGPGIAAAPVESDLTPTSLRVSWTTVRPGTSRIRIGKTSAFERGIVAPDSVLRMAHSVVIGGLEPATIYWMQVFSVAGAETSAAGPAVVSTASPLQSTGVINVYFNKSVDPRVASGTVAAGNENLLARLLQRISGARRSIDATFYSLSGTPGSEIASALAAARNRGVRVRVINELDNKNSVAFSSLQASGVALINDAFDPVNAGEGLMHNKFVVVDAPGGAPESVWVWTGSWNPTNPGTNDDYQNAIEVQDAALGNAYAAEFNEMWGSATETPSAASSRFGQRKTNNTPHRFLIGGRSVQSYFSPSDQTTAHIVEILRAAQHDVSFALLTMTRSDIAGALRAKDAAGLTVRGILDNNTDSGTEYQSLVSGGVDVRLKSGTTGLLHHKYAVIDAVGGSAPARVITGSHNWTNAAETTNNENTLIIEDARIANLYLQEFAARYYQFGGRDTIRVGVEPESSGVPSTTMLHQNYPNPFNATTVLSYELSAAATVKLVIYDLLGREVTTLVHERKPAGVYAVTWDAGAMSSGVYLYRLEVEKMVRQSKMVLVR